MKKLVAEILRTLKVLIAISVFTVLRRPMDWSRRVMIEAISRVECSEDQSLRELAERIRDNK